jgi:chitodextrinase
MYKIVLSWDAGTDNIAVDKYAVYVNGKRYSRPKYTTISITGLDPATTYQIELETLDTSGNASERVSLEATTLLSPTAIDETTNDKKQTVYTIDGRKMNGRQTKGQVSIVQTDNGTKKVIYK